MKQATWGKMAHLHLADPALPDNQMKPVYLESDDGEEVVFAVSQSRSASKNEGQDAVASSLRGRLECCVLCDGHDLHGHLVAREISESLAKILLEKLEPLNIESKEAEQAIINAFELCESRVMWSNAVLQPNSFVRVIEGEWAGRVGYVSEVHDADDTFSIIVVDSDAYHRPRLPRSCLTGSRFVGGSTCVAFIRDSSLGLCRVAVMGDTRALVIGSNLGLEKDPIWEQLNKTSFLTFPHDVFNTAELARLKQEWYGEYEIDGPYLINPLTGCEIQPTRGFGDFDMFGTGYLSIPDVSIAFPLLPGSLVLVASDGIFDDNVWDDFSMVSDFLSTQLRLGNDLGAVASALHQETVVRGKRSGYVDDISFFMARQLPPKSPQIESRRVSHTHGGIPRPPTRSIPAESGVDGLPTPASSFISSSSAALVNHRESASLTEIAHNRRISQGLSILGEDKVLTTPLHVQHDHSLALPSPAIGLNPRNKRHSTADFIDPNAPRYLREQRSETSGTRAENDTIRRTRGPSFMLPEGLETFAEEDGDVALDLAVIGEDTELDLQVHPAEAVRAAISNKKRISVASNSSNGLTSSREGSRSPVITASSPRAPSPSSAPAAASTSIPVSSSLDANLISKKMPRPSMNAVLQRMAARYGHDPKQLDSLVRDLSVV